jgi:NADPH-dependent 2,4-dienoyl-CoA reductase/sulfur reductase-like enzyme/nitrite reductase/ring-hydroxylating ferredoxin subunit
VTSDANQGFNVILPEAFFASGIRPRPRGSTNSEVTTISVARTSDLRPGEMRLVKVSDEKILLLRTPDGRWRALAPTCPHAGAPLEKGALCGSRLICPWHKSCFSASDGALVESPSLESLHAYFLEIVGEEVRVDPGASTQVKHSPEYGKVSPKADQTFVILGGGAAGAAAVRELRSLGFAGQLVMISQEHRTPYDRTLLSKMYLSGQADGKQLPLRPENLLSDCAVDFRVAEINQVDPESRTIRFKGETVPPLQYDEALVATGGKPKLLPIATKESQPLLLRSVEDADALIAAAEQAETAVLIGASFISMEVASAFRERGLAVTMVSEETIPLLKQLGPEMGQLLLEKHLQKGVRFLPETKVISISKVGSSSTVKLSSKEELRTDLVVSGIGIQPATAFLKKISRGGDQSLAVDASMRIIGARHIFAAGDVANFPLPDNRRRVRIEHWRAAQEQARTAAANMMGLEKTYSGVPYFWTYHYGVRYEFFGRMPDHSQLVIDGNLQEPKFVAAYVREGRCEAVFSANRECETAKLFDQMQGEGPPSLEAFYTVLRAS